VAGQFFETHGKLIGSYLSTLSGSLGRLVIALFYFVSLANSLTVSEFGLFATASAVGVVLARVASFGFVSPLYRIATVKPRLLGAYYAGYLAALALSLPVLACAAFLVFKLFFTGQISLQTFALLIISEALLWRGLEVVVIVNNGLNLFGRAAALVVAGTVFRAAAALAFALSAQRSLDQWALWYLAANAAALFMAVAFYLPRRRMKLRLELYGRRVRDSLWTAGAEILFYAQSELDKLAVLAIGGAELAGIYAIIMRLADLTAVPVRSFNMLLVQRLMRAPETLRSAAARAGIELLIFAVSAAGLAFLALALWIYPNALGRNVSIVSGVLILALAVPGFRNIIEYHAELLYARGQTGARMVNLALIGAAKVVLLGFIMAGAPQMLDWLIEMNAVFLILWAGSALLTYAAMRMTARRV
jgi:O-antigen/teichoic acid export membrane protein